MNETNYTTPHAELIGTLIDHWPAQPSLSRMLAKLTEEEAVALEKAIQSFAQYHLDMVTDADKRPNLAGVL